MTPTANREVRPGLAARWSGPGGYREVFALALPLILSTGSYSIQHFIDRVFLGRYSEEALAAALPSGHMGWTLVSFFVGTAVYVNTFVAQYDGARRPDRIGRAVWQAIYFSLGAGVLIGVLGPLVAGPLFRWARHEPAVRDLEIMNFRIFCYGGIFPVMGAALSSFFSGRGRTWPIMWVSLLVTSLNAVLGYAWIFGKWGFPEWGIAGAAWATVTSSAVGTVAYAALFLAPGARREFGTWANRAFDRALFGRLMRFGLPSGLSSVLDMFAFGLFVLFIGRLGMRELAASNMAFQVNLLAFLPVTGIGTAVATLVGRSLGREHPELAVRSTWSAFAIATAYMAVMCVLYVATPQWFTDFFTGSGSSDPAKSAALRATAIVLLRFVAAYSIFDATVVTFSSALRGAGDTRFVMCFTLGMGYTFMVLPAWIISTFRPRGAGLLTAWTSLTIFVFLLSMGFLARFLQGRWKTMRVIEEEMLPAQALVAMTQPATPSDALDA
jgi:MATE family multidrug resistance protein